GGARPAHERGLGVERLAGEGGGGQRRRRQDVAAGARGATRRRSPVAGVHIYVGRPRAGPVRAACPRDRLAGPYAAGRRPQSHPYNQRRRDRRASWPTIWIGVISWPGSASRLAGRLSAMLWFVGL